MFRRRGRQTSLEQWAEILGGTKILTLSKQQYRQLCNAVARPAQKILEVPNISISREQRYLVCDTGSQSTKRQDMLEMLGGMAPLLHAATSMMQRLAQLVPPRCNGC